MNDSIHTYVRYDDDDDDDDDRVLASHLYMQPRVLRQPREW
jgi:hypothetical protein